MILCDQQILSHIAAGGIVIDPFDRNNLGPNSYDLHLGRRLLRPVNHMLDCANNNMMEPILMDSSGFTLRPGILYLAVSVEYTETHIHVPFLDGKSSLGRLGIRIHATAGRGDVGFKGHWTMEIDVVQPVRVYPDMPIGQLIFHEAYVPINKYGDSAANVGNYSQGMNPDPAPIPSRFFKHFPLKKTP